MNDILRLDFQFEDKDAQAAMGRLVEGMRSDEFRGAVGEEVKKISQARIKAGGPAPNGEPWQGLAPLTQAFKKGPGILRESGRLMDSITWQLDGDDGVAIGSAMVYARIHQMGGVIRPKNGKFLVLPDGSRRTSVTIPARPYLRLSGENRSLLTRKATAWLKRLVEG